MYSEEQKRAALLGSDLVAGPLSSAEMAEFSKALEMAQGDGDEALRMLPKELSAKVSDLLGRGLKLSLELNKLSQRGVVLALPDEIPTRLLKGFDDEPAVFFLIGSRALLMDDGAPIVTALPAFKSFDGSIVFVADRSFDELLRDRDVIKALGEGRAILVSDAFRRGANFSPEAAADEASSGYEPGSGSDKQVFISGSRSQTVIPRIVQDSLDTIADKGIGVLIGDSDKGVDKEIIDYLRVPLYRHVTIYTISDTPRVPVESEWNVELVKADESLKPQERQMAKDRAMAEAADWGLALFNPIEKNRYGALQVSAGTLRNAIQMLLSGKMVKFFYGYAGRIASRNLKTLADLEDVISAYREEDLDETEKAVIFSAKGVSPDEDAAEIKFRKIESKYKDLLKSERRAAANLNAGTPAYVQEALPLF